MKLIVVTGGVLSGLGKGVAGASIGHLLAKDYSITPIKCDGYLNVDPGTINPFEHGEVFVLDDGAEVDMDFGHYERFFGITCSGDMSVTMGKVFSQVIEKERKGEYLGEDVQMIPHARDHIIESFKRIAGNSDICIVEIGGTVGDIENELYVQAVREWARQLGRKNAVFVHLAYVPKPPSIGEQKSKPLQQSAQLLLQRGIQPSIIITRSEEPVTESIKEKIEIFTGADITISGHDLDDLYAIPQNFYDQGILTYLNERLELHATYDERWKKLKKAATKKVTVGIAGKYTALEDSYASILEALKHVGMREGVDIAVKWVETTALESAEQALKGIDAVIVPGGFGERGVEGKIKIITHCRTQNIPLLGICYGLQLMVVEFARNVCGLAKAHTTEVDENTPHPVVTLLPEQEGITQKGGTMRLGAYTATLSKGIVQDLYNTAEVSERHRHRYEVNPEYHKPLLDNGLYISGMLGKLAEFIELPNHKYFVATQAHPELKSSLDAPAPLFTGLIKASLL